MSRARPGIRKRALRILQAAGSAALLLAPCAARAENLAGVSLPATEQVGNKNLVLNGMGLRTYSFLHIRIYVAGLYLAAPSHDAQAILDARGDKVLVLHFLRGVPAARVRRAWRNGLEDNCPAPCALPQDELARFLAALPAMHKGEVVKLVFNPDGMYAEYDGAPAGRIANAQFARAMLAVFLGRHASAPRLKAALLGMKGAR